MISLLNSKLLMAMVVLLAGIASYFAYQKHERQIEQKQMQNAYKNMTPRQKKAVNGLGTWGNSVGKQKLK